ncbi:MAG TPA: hypothetical protein VK120_02095 [Sporosarcina sp.]|nr:hypothetical protein [Sporosarcina sp.]
MPDKKEVVNQKNEHKSYIPPLLHLLFTVVISFLIIANMSMPTMAYVSSTTTVYATIQSAHAGTNGQTSEQEEVHVKDEATEQHQSTASLKQIDNEQENIDKEEDIGGETD